MEVSQMTQVQGELATTGEPGRKLAWDEFFFPLQRIDRLDEKVTMQFGEIRRELGTRIDGLDSRLDSLRAWAIGLLFTLLAGFGGVIFSLRR